MEEAFDKEKLKAIIEQHKKHLTSAIAWNKYRANKNLPHSQTLISHFGSWNNVKKALNLEQNKQSRPVKFTDEEIYTIISENKEHYTSVIEWDAHAVKHNLPSHDLITGRLDPDSIYQETGVVVRWTDRIIKDKILEYFPTIPPTMRGWNELSKTEHLPSATTIARRFGKWNILIAELYRE